MCCTDANINGVFILISVSQNAPFLGNAKIARIEKNPDLTHEHINLWHAKLQLMKIKDVVNI